MHTFTISGVEYLVTRWPKPKIEWAIDWVAASSKNQYGDDTGAAEDVYTTEIGFYDTEAVINAYQTALEAVREGFTMTGFTEEVFAPNVDHSGDIDAAIVSMKPRRDAGQNAAGGQMYEFSVKLRAIAPPLLSTTPSLSTLRVQHGAESDKTYTSGKVFAYDGTPIYGDRRVDIGRYPGKFLQTKAELQAILAYILITARAAAITFPSIGVTYPFGVVRGGLPKSTKIVAFSFTRKDFMMWNLSITFAEHI